MDKKKKRLDALMAEYFRREVEKRLAPDDVPMPAAKGLQLHPRHEAVPRRRPIMANLVYACILLIAVACGLVSLEARFPLKRHLGEVFERVELNKSVTEALAKMKDLLGSTFYRRKS
jgi:hypothetical protein